VKNTKIDQFMQLVVTLCQHAERQNIINEAISIVSGIPADTPFTKFDIRANVMVTKPISEVYDVEKMRAYKEQLKHSALEDQRRVNELYEELKELLK
jgi:hypothetical protein